MYLTYSFDQFTNTNYGLAPSGILDVYSPNTETQEFEARMKMRF